MRNLRGAFETLWKEKVILVQQQCPQDLER